MARIRAAATAVVGGRCDVMSVAAQVNSSRSAGGERETMVLAAMSGGTI